jgi:hypothetical protein
MSSKDRIDYDPTTHTLEQVHFENDGRAILELKQNVQSILDANKALFAETDKHTAFRNRDLVRVASIPMVVMEDLKRRGILGRGYKIADQARFKAWLNDPENRHFRTTAGRV